MKYHPTELQHLAIMACRAPYPDWMRLVTAIRRETGLTVTQITIRIRQLASGNYQEAKQ